MGMSKGIESERMKGRIGCRDGDSGVKIGERGRRSRQVWVWGRWVGMGGVVGGEDHIFS